MLFELLLRDPKLRVNSSEAVTWASDVHNITMLDLLNNDPRFDIYQNNAEALNEYRLKKEITNDLEIRLYTDRRVDPYQL